MATAKEHVEAAKQWGVVAVEGQKEGNTVHPSFAAQMAQANALIAIASILMDQTKIGGMFNK